jgi:hypothetical protein
LARNSCKEVDVGICDVSAIDGVSWLPGVSQISACHNTLILSSISWISMEYIHIVWLPDTECGDPAHK